MAKKALAKVKASSSKTKKTLPVPAKGRNASIPAPSRTATLRAPADDARYQQAVQNYEQALKALQAQKFDRAKQLLEKVVASGSKELIDRATMHLNICNQQLKRVSTSFKTPEEHYDYAISLMNMGDYVTAREHLERLSRDHKQLDFVWYGLAVLESLTGHYQEALHHLGESIRLNKSNRFQARNDSDFKNMADDPRFTELLYPESSSAS